MCVAIELHYSTLFLSVNSFCQMMMMPNCCVQIVLCNMYTIHHSLALPPSLFLFLLLLLFLFLCFSHYSSILHISFIFLFFSLLFVCLHFSFCLIFCKLSLYAMIINKIKWNAHISAFCEHVKLEQFQQKQQQQTTSHLCYWVLVIFSIHSMRIKWIYSALCNSRCWKQ